MNLVIAKLNRNRVLAEDGLGWLWDYVTRLVKTYPSFTRQYVLDELPMMEGWAWFAASIEMDGWLSFCEVKRTGEGYVKQEVKRLIKQAHEEWEKQK